LLDWGAQGSLTWRTSLRERYNPYFIGVDANRSLSDQQNQILSNQWDHHLGYTLDGRWMGWQHSTTLGWDAMEGDYERWMNGLFVPGGDRLLGRATSQAWFVESTANPHEDVAIHAGLRWNKFSSKQRQQSYSRNCPSFSLPCTPYSYMPTGADSAGVWLNRTAEMGGNWQMTPTLLGSVNVSRNFRAPNIDELLLADSALGPQQGLNHEVSIKHVFSERLSWAATLFALENTGEIYYGVDASGLNTVNRNRSGRTQRRGVELDVSWQLSKQVRLHGQASYLVPRLEGNPGGIALVARTTASLHVAWQPHEHWAWSLNGRYVGARPDGNESAESSQYFLRTSPYSVWDLGLRYTQHAAQLKVGVQNVFNEIYSTQVYSQTYYPMPERHVYVSLDWSL
jgi:iron complex outermembrane recepter protein